MKINLQKYPPVIYQDKDLIYLASGSIAMGFKISLPEIYSLSEKDFEDLHSNWARALKGLPSGTIVHKQDIYLKTAYDGMKIHGNTFLAHATSNYFNLRDYIDHHSYLFFTWPGTKNITKGFSANPFIKKVSRLPKGEDQKLRAFVQSVREAINFLDNSKTLSFTRLREEEVWNLTTDYFNGFNNAVSTDMLLGKDLSIGDQLYDILAINNEKSIAETVSTSKPNSRFTSDEISFHQGFIDDLGLSLNQNHIVNQVLVLDDRSHWIGILNKKREELLKSIQFGTQNKITLERIETILSEINSDDQARLVRGHFNITFWAKENTELAGIRSYIQASLKELDIKAYQPKGSALHRYFLNSYFGFIQGFSSEDYYVSDLRHGLCLWLNNTNYRDDSKGIMFNDRLFNIPVIKDVWDEDKRRIKARNFAIFAPTGEGKSFLANNILRQFYEVGTRLVIIDLGGSYSKFAKLYPKDHIILRYEQGKSLGINPFYIENPDDLGPERIEDLTAFLLELSASGHKVAKEREVALKKLLLDYYQSTSDDHSLESFYDYLGDRPKSSNRARSDKYFDTEHFLHILSEYVGDGIYSFLFETNKDQSYKLEDKRMIIFELDEVKDNREILSVMLKLIKSAIQRTIWKNRSERGIILFDEFAKQLKFENVLESVEFYYQAIRKQNGAIGIILQSINQLPENSTSASILENTQVIYSLRNEKGYDALYRRLNLSTHDLNQLNSIRNNLKGNRKYTEIFIKIGQESNIFRLEVPPEVYAAYLTDGKESEILLELYKKHGSMEGAIQDFVTNYLKTKP
ncbi:TraG family conjugative transposon ATPase [Gramella sp. GC03-9]|uniref:TraG family conjugative transposon ATPase n=1 Tax=Christiangramia oceanisediminis TaxID=2920386 RepID=A0A9X2KZX4_9FLAO|nr:TraG family conjugative transposon ATPase [Gramella oceanisediminis]MCP9201304.1 TraG family conjugative transposon ATPase [Gramella oceanisediminis]